MQNTVYLETFTSPANYQDSHKIDISLESLVSYSIYKFCSPDGVDIKFVYKNGTIDNVSVFTQHYENVKIYNANDIPWQVRSCNFPVVKYEDTIISGLCGVARHICKYRSMKNLSHEHEEGLLGFRKSCLQAPNEVSIWTKFCEVDIIKTVNNILGSDQLQEIPKNLIRFENHLNKPVKLHNIYKIARELKKENMNLNSNEIKQDTKEMSQKERVSKPRKWKSNIKKSLEIDCTTKIEELHISHKFAEGPFLTLADLILFISYYIIIQSIGTTYFESLLPLTYKWFDNIANITELRNILDILPKVTIKPLKIDNVIVPTIDDVSLYKSDPKRHNPKKRLFTKESDIENALSALQDGMELKITYNKMNSGIKWDDIPNGANPCAGHLPDDRIVRKSQQLENLALAVLNIAKDGDLIVDFCSGSGHLGILLAHLLPKCTVILLENKEQSLLRARARVHEMCLKNVLLFQCNLDFFVGKFDIGIALHACGVASDLVLDKCLKANAKFVLCPCCYGSLHATDRLTYPRSAKFSSINIDQYLCIGHAADQTHKDHHLAERGAKCMAVIDSDRARLAEEFGYRVTLSRLTPLSCTPKNNLLIGIPC
ncbi:unnamed protein product [Parnassius mnemosyne]|uniref:Methyltransferase domain-containing protein n=1 Tax=Parnassius mnemosyne TaxID=213953 RepID=A0AAV1KUT1_9NEOP